MIIVDRPSREDVRFSEALYQRFHFGYSLSSSSLGEVCCRRSHQFGEPLHAVRRVDSMGVRTRRRKNLCNNGKKNCYKKGEEEMKDNRKDIYKKKTQSHDR